MLTTLYCAHCLTTFPTDGARCSNLGCGKSRPRAGWGNLLAEGDTLDRNYRILRVLAFGGAGLTYLARELDDAGEMTGPQLAIKVLYTQRASGPFLQRLANEAQIMQQLNHPHIVDCLGFVHRAGKEPYLITRFEHGGSLSEHVETVGPLSASVSASIIRQILLALDEAHRASVVHRDMKPDNVLLQIGVAAHEIPHVKLTDFGIAKVSGGVGGALTAVGTFIGTPEYAAPEQFEGALAGPAADVFAVGALLVFLITGKTPIEFAHRMDIQSSYQQLLATMPHRIPVGTGDSKDTADRLKLQEILDHIMLRDPADRWTIRQVLARLDVMLTGKPLVELPGTLELTLDGSKQLADFEAELAEKSVADDAALDELPVEETAEVPDVNTPAPGDSRDSTSVPSYASTPSYDADEDAGVSWVAATAAGGIGLVVGLGALLLFVALVVGGWMAFSEPGAGIVDLVADNPAHQKEIAIMQERMDDAGGRIALSCGLKTDVKVRLLVKPEGDIFGVRAEAASISTAQKECVEAGLQQLRLPRTSAGGAKVRLLLKGS